MVDAKAIGHKIVSARKQINYSQAELARRISISPQAVGKWERGESMPDVGMLHRLAEIFGVDLNYFSENTQIERPNAIEAHEPAVASTHQDSGRTNNSPSDQPQKNSQWGWDMSQGNWADADFSGLKNVNAKFSGSNIRNCKFVGSTLTDLFFKGNNIVNSDFSRANLRNSKIQSSHLSRNLFFEGVLVDTVFRETDINKCEFTSTDFSGAELVSCSFDNNKVENAVWKFTSFKRCALSNIVFDGRFEDCAFDNSSFSKVTFRNATLVNTFFKCPSLRRVVFIGCVADRMTYEFLKNGKASLEGVSLLEAASSQ
jgi:uncharacterized protein YjbI with pentapeptide repeats